MYFKPSQIAIDAPTPNGYKNPIDDSYAWWSGNTENNLSVSFKSTYALQEFMFSAKFLLHNITPFDWDVVPEVKNKILNSSGSISIFLNESSPASTSFFPSSKTVFNPTFLPFTLS